jgi:acylphosphatase
MERRTVTYSGNVQGVGFRYTAQRLATRYAVTGYVRNLPNGTVELVAEGQPNELDKFLAAVSERMRDYIRKVNVVKQPATGEFDDFRIRH